MVKEKETPHKNHGFYPEYYQKSPSKLANKTRNGIEKAFFYLAMEKDVKDITTNDLASFSGFAPTTIRHYYTSARRLVKTYKEDVLNALSSLGDRCQDREIEEFEFDYLVHFFSILKKVYKKFYPLYYCTQDDEFRRIIHNKFKYDYLYKFIAKYSSLAVMQTEYAVSFMINGIFGMVKVWIEEDFNNTPEDLAKFALYVLSKGFQ